MKPRELKCIKAIGFPPIEYAAIEARA